MDLEVAKAESGAQGVGRSSRRGVRAQHGYQTIQVGHRLTVLREIMFHRECWVADGKANGKIRSRRSEVEHHLLARQPIRLPISL
jgi:hypothetical protein